MSEKLFYMKKKFKELPDQKTIPWLEGRMFNFGGSEISIVLDKNKHETFDVLLHKKIKKETIKTNSTEWGHLFEPIAKQILKDTFKYDIEEFGSIPHPKYPISYSPDGIFIDYLEGQEILRLLEIKCPIWRGVEEIPEYYLYQVQTGMNILPVYNCLFVQFKFRKCALWSESNSPDYDRMFHKEPFKRIPKSRPIQFGYIYWEHEDPLIDLGNLEDITNYPTHIKPQYIFNQNIYKEKGHILKWKLFDMKTFDIKPDTQFLQKQEKIIWSQYHKLYQELQKSEVTNV